MHSLTSPSATAASASAAPSRSTLVTLVLCGLCLTMLFLKAAFGICVGCALQRALTKTSPQYCPGDACRVTE